MIWQRTDPDRLHPQEQALLALCDRVKTLEQVLTNEMDANRAMRRQVDRLEATVAALMAILEREE